MLHLTKNLALCSTKTFINKKCILSTPFDPFLLLCSLFPTPPISVSGRFFSPAFQLRFWGCNPKPIHRCWVFMHVVSDPSRAQQTLTIRVWSFFPLPNPAGLLTSSKLVEPLGPTPAKRSSSISLFSSEAATKRLSEVSTWALFVRRETRGHHNWRKLGAETEK